MFRKERGGRQPRNKAPAGNMDRGYRDMARGGLVGADYSDYRGYDRPMPGAERDPLLREGLLGDPMVGGGYLAGRSGYCREGVYDRERELMENLMQQRLLEQQLSLREQQLALANSLLMQQDQLQKQQFVSKGLMDTPRGVMGGEIREDFKHPRFVYNRSQPLKNRQTGQDSNAGGKAKGTGGNSGSQRNQSGANGHGQSSAESERVPDAPKKWRKAAGGKKESDDGGNSRHSTGSAANSRDPVKPKSQSKGSAASSGSKAAGSGASASSSGTSASKSLQDADRSKGTKKNNSSKKPAACDRHKATSQHKKGVDSTQGSDSDNVDDDDTSNKERKGYCYICDVPLNVTFKHHQRQSCHKLLMQKKKLSRKQMMQVTMGCRWCNVESFMNFAELLAHRATQEHVKNKELYGRQDWSKGDSGGAERDMKMEMPPDQFDPAVVVGEACMKEWTGWYCTVCKKFCNSESTSKEAHCTTEVHFKKYKRFVYTSLKRPKVKAWQSTKEVQEQRTDAEAAAAAGNKDNSSDSDTTTTTALSTEQPQVDSGELTNGADGLEPEQAEAGGKGSGARETKDKAGEKAADNKTEGADEDESSASGEDGEDEVGWVDAEEEEEVEEESAAVNSVEVTEEAWKGDEEGKAEKTQKEEES